MKMNACVYIQVYDTIVQLILFPRTFCPGECRNCNTSQQNPGKTELRQGMLGSAGDWRARDSQHNLALFFSI